MRYRHDGTQNSHVDVRDRERALRIDELEAFTHLALDLGATPPPPAKYVHHISVFGEEIRIGARVVLIPCGCLQGLNLANRGDVVLLLGGSRNGESQRHRTYHERNSA